MAWHIVSNVVQGHVAKLWDFPWAHTIGPGRSFIDIVAWCQSTVAVSSPCTCNMLAIFYNKYSCSFCGWFHNCVVPLSGKTCGRSFRTFGVHAQKGLGFFGAKLGSPRITLLHPLNRIRTYLAIWHWFDTICVLYIISTFSSACITTHIYIYIVLLCFNYFSCQAGGPQSQRKKTSVLTTHYDWLWHTATSNRK